MAVSNRVCPLLLDAKKYDPDTLNLLEDKAARDYWLKCFEEMVQKFAKFAVKSSQIGDASVEERANSFCQDVMKQVEQITRQDCGDKLAIRDLLNLNEMCLRRHGFNDPWYNQKKLENATSIGLFKKRLNHLDNIHSPEEKWEQLVKGLLAGNMFDWGAQAVTEILEKDNSFGLEEALSRIQSRPWLVDGLDSWLERTQSIDLLRSQEDDTTTTDLTTTLNSQTELSETETSVAEEATTEALQTTVSESETTQISQTAETSDTTTKEDDNETPPPRPLIAISPFPFEPPPLPLGILQNQNGEKIRKRCQCIERKVKHKVVNVTYIPLNPSIRLPGHNRNFTCNCSHLKRVNKIIKP